MKLELLEPILNRGKEFEQSAELKNYAKWREARRIDAQKRKSMCDVVGQWKNPPLISVVMPVYNVPQQYLEMAIDSVLNQVYPHWKLCIADDCSTAPHIRPTLERYSKKDPRIQVVYRSKNGQISAVTNSALELAKGDYIALLDNDDELTEHALYKNAEAIVADPALDMLYSDEDKLDMKGTHIEPFFKPDWSHEYFLECMYTCHLGVYRTALIREIGGFRSAFDTAQDYDIVLRVIEKTKRIRHIPDILYHWRMLPSSTASGSGAKPKAHIIAQRALREHLERMGAAGTVEDGPAPGYHRVRFNIIGKPKVSIIIPSTCASKVIDGVEINYLDRCVNSILSKSSWREFEIIILDRHQMQAEMEARFRALGVRRITYADSFNWSYVNTLGARNATGSHLLFMNDDMEVITPDWLESMLEFSQRDGVGVVGAKLLFPNGNLQHAGVIIKDGEPGHHYYAARGDHFGYFCGNVVHRNYSAVTGACMMTRPEVFFSVGGFSVEFPLNYNDVDYCLKVIGLGKRIVYTPYAKLWHHESVTKSGVFIEELKKFQNKWGTAVNPDPFFNPNLSTAHWDYRVGN